MAKPTIIDFTRKGGAKGMLVKLSSPVHSINDIVVINETKIRLGIHIQQADTSLRVFIREKK